MCEILNEMGRVEEEGADPDDEDMVGRCYSKCGRDFCWDDCVLERWLQNEKLVETK
jgi:hypothetical protein